ncbi:MAG: hypothetical protein E6Q97_24485 [Desulfurellales bacterium]|nr:MAG: hypothetical protein E6Q97_24485 [Desulfurellales bacterium]
MTTFVDTAGRTWSIVVNYATVVRVQSETGVDLTKICDRTAATDRDLENPVTLFRVLCAALRPQLEERRLTPDDLGAALDEERAEAAALALYEGVIDFFRGPKRETLRRAFRKVIGAAAAHRDRATKTLEEMIETPEFQTLIERSIGGSSAAGLPELSASSPVP